VTLPSLRTNQRNLLRLVAQHQQRYPGLPCYLGNVTASRQNVFLKAVSSLEDRKLIEIDRSSDNFRAWTIKLLVPLEDVIPQHQETSNA
jgi:hypothetical protein